MSGISYKTSSTKGGLTLSDGEGNNVRDSLALDQYFRVNRCEPTDDDSVENCNLQKQKLASKQYMHVSKYTPKNDASRQQQTSRSISMKESKPLQALATTYDNTEDDDDDRSISTIELLSRSQEIGRWGALPLPSPTSNSAAEKMSEASQHHDLENNKHYSIANDDSHNREYELTTPRLIKQVDHIMFSKTDLSKSNNDILPSGMLHTDIPISELSINPTSSEESEISAFSKASGMTSLGSMSTSVNSAKVQEYVERVVKKIVAEEVQNAGALQESLSSALRSKMKLKSRLKKLTKMRNDETRRQYEALTISHLTRKAAEIKECVEIALEQAEESKQRAVEFAKHEKDKEIMELKAQLREARAYGVDADGSLKKALVLVESNQRAVNKVAKKDKHVIEGIKQELEISFLSAMEEFENWSETQLKMIANISEEGEVDDVRLQQMKQSIVSTTNGMDELQAYMTKQNQRLSQILQCI